MKTRFPQILHHAKGIENLQRSRLQTISSSTKASRFVLVDDSGRNGILAGPGCGHHARGPSANNQEINVRSRCGRRHAGRGLPSFSSMLCRSLLSQMMNVVIPLPGIGSKGALHLGLGFKQLRTDRMKCLGDDDSQILLGHRMRSRVVE